MYVNGSPSGSFECEASSESESPSLIVYGPPTLTVGAWFAATAFVDQVTSLENSEVALSGLLAVALTNCPGATGIEKLNENVALPLASVVRYASLKASVLRHALRDRPWHRGKTAA